MSTTSIDSISPCHQTYLRLDETTSQLAVYPKQVDYAITLSGASTTQTLTGFVAATGGVVDIAIDQLTFTGASSVLSSAAIAANIRPVETKYFPILRQDNTTKAVGLITIATTGIMTIASTETGGTWSANTCTIYPTVISYKLI